MKFKRHAQILRIIEENDIETQEDLANELRKTGMKITQATVSRDIKELRLVKVLTPSGVHKYTSMSHSDKSMSERLIRVFSESVLSIEYANNLVVIKTIAAGAQAAASAIDALNWSEIIGCIAGDDTILVVLRDNSMVEAVMKRFNKMRR